MRAMTYIDSWTRGFVLAAAIMTFGAASGAAQGWIEPGVNRGGFAVDKVRSEVRVRVMGRVAEIEVSEWFVNEGSRLAEGEYLYPLSGEAVFQGFSLYQGETELRGEIMDADRAREIYEEIVRRRADPALIELAGQGLIRARVFPIEPGETRKVSLRYTQVLHRAGNALQLQYAGGVRGGAQVGAGDVRRDAPQGVETSFVVEIDDCDTFLDPFSPTHTLDFDRDGDLMTVSIDEEIVGRMSLFLPIAGDAVGLSVATHRPVGEDGYFMLTLSPDRVAGDAQPRDITVVMDVSGSMSGEKMIQARAALHQLLGSLARDDRFRLLSFSSAVRMFSQDWTDARGNGVERAQGWIDRLAADGGTNIEAALTEAFRLESPRDRLPVVVFVTDGLPSVGVESPEALALIAESQAGRARVFAFGVGNDVNTQLLDRLGEAGRGDTDYVEPGENVERALSLLAAKIRYPVLTELALVGGPIDLEEVYPVRLPDVFVGQELVLFGRFDGDGQGQVTVQGERMGEELDFSTELIFPEATEANDYIPRLWASRKLGHLERQVWTEGMSDELAEEIRSLALRYGLPSRYTSYLVQEPTVVVANGPVPLDALIGPRASGSGTFASRPSSKVRGNGPATAPTSGASAVQAAESARRLRGATSEADLQRAENELLEQVFADVDDEAGGRDAVGGRVFELRDDVWMDLAYVENAAVFEVEVYSAAWFDLIAAVPEIEAVLRAHENVVIAGAEISLKVGEAGVSTFSPEELREVARDFRGGASG
jgi:Ca-activated chloride channel homolog